MRRLRLLLLAFTAGFNVLFWLLLGYRYQLKGFLLGYPNTVVVGSVALVLLAYLTASVRQTLLPRLARSVGLRASMGQTRPPQLARSPVWRALWHVGRLLVLLVLGGWVLAVAFFCLAIVWWVTWLVLVTVLAVIGAQTVFGLGLLLALLPSYVAGVLLFQTVALVLHEAALPKPATLVATTLAAVLSGLTFVWVGAWGFFFVEGYAPSCSQRFVSPSGQHTLVRESRDDFDGDPLVRVYVESGWWLRELPAPSNMFGSCTDTSLRVQWSADEKRIDWQNWNSHGYWQW